MALWVTRGYDIINTKKHKDGIIRFGECENRGITLASLEAKTMKSGRESF